MKNEAKVWRLIPHHLVGLRNESIDYYMTNSIIAIGWGGIGDIDAEGYSTQKDIGDAIQYKCQLRNRNIGGPSLLHFFSSVQSGDYVILSGTKHRRPVVMVDGNYTFNSQGFDKDHNYKHQRAIVLTDINYQDLIKDRSWTPVSGHSIRSPFIECYIP